MITPIRTLSMNDICKREDDLLVSKDDIKKLAKNERNKAIDDFLREIKIDVIATTFGLRICDAERIAQQLKDGGTDGSQTTDN